MSSSVSAESLLEGKEEMKSSSDFYETVDGKSFSESNDMMVANIERSNDHDFLVNTFLNEEFVYDSSSFADLFHYITTVGGIVYFMYCFGSIVSIIGVLYTSQYSKTECNNLLYWVYVQFGVVIVALLSKVLHTYRKFSKKIQTDNKLIKILLKTPVYVQRAINVSWLFWTLIGCIWIFKSGCKESKNSIYYLSLGIIIVNIILVAALILISFCMFAAFAIIYLYQCCTSTISGATDTMINNLDCKEYNEGIVDKADAQCAICLNNYEEKESIKFLPCTPKQHHFHNDCINEWLKLNKVCPYCKNPIDNVTNCVNIQK
jgi:hypothetical protein